jgi:hypothetical protein
MANILDKIWCIFIRSGHTYVSPTTVNIFFFTINTCQPYIFYCELIVNFAFFLHFHALVKHIHPYHFIWRRVRWKKGLPKSLSCLNKDVYYYYYYYCKNWLRKDHDELADHSLRPKQKYNPVILFYIGFLVNCCMNNA